MFDNRPFRIVRSPWLRALGVSVLVVALTGLPAASQTAEEGPRAGAAKVGKAEGPRIWWNKQRFIDGLSLTAEQRREMDESLAAVIASRREKNRNYAQVRRELTAAAVAGEWEKVEKLREGLAAEAGELSRLDTGLVTAVVRKLTADQRQKLRSGFPGLLSRPWLVGGPGYRPQRRGGRGDGAERRSSESPSGATQQKAGT
ncbi:MAG: hypothetical protein GY856_27505 [bacterium]|nr:hypothetical protein [bacterium]